MYTRIHIGESKQRTGEAPAQAAERRGRMHLLPPDEPPQEEDLKPPMQGGGVRVGGYLIGEWGGIGREGGDGAWTSLLPLSLFLSLPRFACL